MKIGLLLTTYNRPELLEKVLNSLKTQLSGNVAKVVIIDDCSTNAKTLNLLGNFAKTFPDIVSLVHHSTNRGNSRTLNAGLMRLFKGCRTNNFESVDYAVVLDSDATTEPDNWITTLVTFLSMHPEVGVAFPNRPGSYIRLHRDGYDEIEFGITICYAVPRQAYLAVAGKDGQWFDENLTTSWDCDTCYRLRRLGYRIAVVNETVVTDLGIGNSTLPSENFAKGNFEFNKKWNEILLGPFLYKSPMMLRWEDYPLNMQFRRLVNAQQGAISAAPTDETLSDHKSERISYLSCVGNFPSQEKLSAWLIHDMWINHNPVWEDINMDLALGTRPFDYDKDADNFQLKEINGHPIR